MSAVKLREIRSMSLPDARKQVADFRAELAKERAVVAGGTRPENPGKIKSLRRSVARLLTVINEKEKSGKEGQQAETKKPADAKKPVEKKEKAKAEVKKA